MAFQRTLNWYEDQLDRDDLSPETREKYEQEADRIVRATARAVENIKLRQQQEQARFEEIKKQLQSGDINVIDAVGIPEFGNDYELVKEQTSHIVYSKVANDGQESRHIHEEEKDAVAHYRKLIWDRLYTKYVRSGELDSLRQME